MTAIPESRISEIESRCFAMGMSVVEKAELCRGYRASLASPAVPDGLVATLDKYEAQTRALPCQHEMPERGCSTYNWRMAVILDLRAMLAAAPEPPAADTQQGSGDAFGDGWGDARFVCRVLESGGQSTLEDRTAAIQMVQAFRQKMRSAIDCELANAAIREERDDLRAALRAVTAERDALRAAAKNVVRWDRSDNDNDCVADIDALRALLTGNTSEVTK